MQRSTPCSKVGTECIVDYTSQFDTKEVFKSKEELLSWVQEVGKRNGFVIVIKTSDYGGGRRRPRIYLACERSGQYRVRKKLKVDSKNMISKLTGTKKCGCPFDLRAHKLMTDDDWILDVACGVHNHSLAEHLEGHSYAGRLLEEKTSVDMSKSMVSPKEILVTLKQRDALNVTTMKTIYNIHHKQKVVEMDGSSQMQQLLGELEKYNYIERHRCEEKNMTITDLFWAHSVSLDFLRSFPLVLIKDCIHKTNRYGLPLLEIIGVTSTNMSFFVAFAYIQFEHVDNYIWVLNTLRSLMNDIALPELIVTDKKLALMNAIDRVLTTSRHFLCRWQISRNILTKCKKMFETRDKREKFINSWNFLVLSSIEGEYNEHLATMLKEFCTYPEAINYVIQTWLNPYKEKFVTVWTDSCMHCGNVTSDRTCKLKRQLCSGQVDFECSWTKIYNLLELQHTDIKASFEKSLTVVQHQFRPSHFRELRGNISIIALEIVLVESKRAEFTGIDSSACGCVIRHTHGLPCAHEIANYIRQGRPIPIYSIHSHWRTLEIVLELTCEPELEMIVKFFNDCDTTKQLEILKKLGEIANPDSTFLIEPNVKPNPRGCPAHKKIDVSIRRDPYAFEIVQSGHDGHSPKGTQMTALASVQVNKKRHFKQKAHMIDVLLTFFSCPITEKTTFQVFLLPGHPGNGPVSMSSLAEASSSSSPTTSMASSSIGGVSSSTASSAR
ncbi:unnamed protein product [Camellia sinensis]